MHMHNFKNYRSYNGTSTCNLNYWNIIEDITNLQLKRCLGTGVFDNGKYCRFLGIRKIKRYSNYDEKD